jgi:uncharacterized integral membrane protein
MSTPSTQKPGKAQKVPGERRSSGELMRTGGLVVLAILLTLFAVLNLESVKVDWIIGSGHAPLIVVIVISVLVGIVLTYLAERLNRKKRS